MIGRTLLLVFLATTAYCGAFAASPRFVDYEGEYAYALRIASPWSEGGSLVFSLPEHLEYMPHTQGILRHNDKEPNGHWKVAGDGLSAILDVDSATIEGVHVLGEARIVDDEHIRITMKISNRSEISLGSIRPLYCFQYAGLTGFPQGNSDNADNFKHSYVLYQNKPVRLDDLPRKNMKTSRLAASVQGYLPPNEPDEMWFSRQTGGVIPHDLDAAVIGVTSLDDQRKVVLGWTPGKVMLSNKYIPCIHADPFYGTIAKNKAAVATCLITFTDRPIAEVMEEYSNDGIGLHGPAIVEDIHSQ